MNDNEIKKWKRIREILVEMGKTSKEHQIYVYIMSPKKKNQNNRGGKTLIVNTTIHRGNKLQRQEN